MPRAVGAGRFIGQIQTAEQPALAQLAAEAAIGHDPGRESAPRRDEHRRQGSQQRHRQVHARASGQAGIDQHAAIERDPGSKNPGGTRTRDFSFEI